MNETESKFDLRTGLEAIRDFCSAGWIITLSFFIFFALASAGAHGGIAPDLRPQASVYTISDEITLLCVLMTVIMLNGLLSCLWTLKPGWAVLFALISAFGTVFSASVMLGNGAVNANSIPIFIYCLLALAASLISLVVRRSEWGCEPFRLKPAPWVDALMGLALAVLFELSSRFDFNTSLTTPLGIVLFVVITLAFIARHIYIVRTLIVDRKNFA